VGDTHGTCLVANATDSLGNLGSSASWRSLPLSLLWLRRARVSTCPAHAHWYVDAPAHRHTAVYMLFRRESASIPLGHQSSFLLAAGVPSAWQAATRATCDGCSLIEFKLCSGQRKTPSAPLQQKLAVTHVGLSGSRQSEPNAWASHLQAACLSRGLACQVLLQPGLAWVGSNWASKTPGT
jgi:hypothetical protein